MSDPANAAILAEQQAYYRARAAEYDEWFLRTGRYDRGEDANRHWFADVALLQQELVAFGPHGSVLELACGTGWWTEQLARDTDDLTCVDASPEVLAINRAKLGAHPVEYQQADLFMWQPQRQYDVVFFSFWLSHVPPEQFAPFWAAVRAALKPGGRVFLIDSRPHDASGAVDHQMQPAGELLQQRKLNDGRAFAVVKRYDTPDGLADQLAHLGWRGQFATTPHFFLYGTATPDV